MGMSLICIGLALLGCVGLVCALPLRRERGLWSKPVMWVGVKVLLCALLLLGAQTWTIYRYMGGSLMAPDLPRWVVLCLSALQLWVILTAVCTIVVWALALVCWVCRLRGLSRVRPYLVGGALGLSLAVAIVAVANGVSRPAVVTEPVVIEDLAPQLQGVKIVYLTDLHVGVIQKKDFVADVVAQVNALEPDLILFGGDLFDGEASRVAPMLEPLRELKSKYGKFFCAGNHEYYHHYAVWQPRLEALGLTLLENRTQVLQINGAPLTLVGISDSGWWLGAPMVPLWQVLREKPVGPCILLAHQPGAARMYVGENDCRVHLQLSGHTHGGQIPGARQIISRANNGFVEGAYQLTEWSKLYVSRGVGLWCGFPYRLWCPPEVTLLVLQKRTQEVNDDQAE